MSFYGFCTIHGLEYGEVRSFKVWLGSTWKSFLPEDEWLKLYEEFRA